MAQIVLGIGTSHSPVLSIPGELWESYAENDRNIRELVFPPEGIALDYDRAVAAHVPAAIKERRGNEDSYKEQFKRCNAALDTLRDSLRAARPDITIIISDDQDEWFFDSNMPALSVYWGETAPLVPRPIRPDAPPVVPPWARGYGDIPLDVPVPAAFGRHLIEFLMDNEFDISHMTYAEDSYSGKVARRFPTPDGELDFVLETEPHAQGLPHGFSFIVKRLFENKPGPILPVFQNTCYPPNHVRPWRSYDLGRKIAEAVQAWDEDIRVALIASGGLSHFVVDEDLDRTVIEALRTKDEQTLRNLPRHRLLSGTSETLNWVAVGGALAASRLQAELIDYVPVYRSEAGTGGGWTFMLWR
ncbi:hypothetical protein [Streptomyces sp. NBC_00829]|uniref:DODA-type extradiol aromatic ring-opening family dioxygenase n=1 Tax=Streptomyces sp. NBC_00829 TaxID=2903679 RepID=UPI00386BDB15|nr:hypothetical protein OG293_05910 [Streptomyces sp. NBC_00829]